MDFSDDSEVKGYALLSYVTSLREKTALWASVQAQLRRRDAEVARFFAGEIYANHWYPRTQLHELLGAVDEVTHGDENVLRELGAAAAEYQVGYIYRVFLSFVTPALVFRRAGSIWRRQASAGTFSVIEDGDKYLVGLLDDPTVPVQLPKVMAGWSDRIIIMLHRRPTQTQVTSPSPGKYRFLVSWA